MTTNPPTIHLPVPLLTPMAVHIALLMSVSKAHLLGPLVQYQPADVSTQTAPAFDLDVACRTATARVQFVINTSANRHLAAMRNTQYR